MTQAKATKKPAATRRAATNPRKSEITRQRIMDAAARVFAERGYGHTRLSDVAQVAGTHAGGIYYYFASREVLVEELLRTCTLRAIDAVNQALATLPETATTAELMLVAAEAQIAGIIGADAYNRAFTKIYPQVPEEIRAKHQPLLRQYFAIWRGLIRRGQLAGEIRPGIEPPILRLAIAGSLQWTAEWASSSHGSARKLTRSIMDIFFHGMFTTPPEPGAGPAGD